MNWKAFVATLILVPILDAIWLGLIVGNFYTTRIGDLARFGDDGKMKPILWAAGIVYVLLAVGVSYFIGPMMNSSREWTESLVAGAILGLVVYGVYDFTNMATLKQWPMELALADIAWGSFVIAASSAAGYFLTIQFE